MENNSRQVIEFNVNQAEAFFENKEEVTIFYHVIEAHYMAIYRNVNSTQ